MKLYIILSLWLVKGVFCYSQNTVSISSSAVSVLSKVFKKLNSLQSIRFDNIRELDYSSENYHNLSKWNVYYSFQTADTIIGFKYQIYDSTLKQVFNGTEKFDLDNNTRTIRVNNSPDKKSFSSLSALYNSMITLKNILPLIIADKNAIKVIADTTINNSLYHLVTINIGRRRIQNLGNGFDAMKTESNFIYKIIIGKDNYLPLIILQKNDLNDDFIRTSFSNIESNPDPPSEMTWYYSTYTNDYKPAADIIVPQLISIGSSSPDWKLKTYNQNKMISLDDLKGEVILLDFWIKNCGPCILSVPYLNKLQDRFGSRGFRIISINSYDSNEDISLFYNKHRIKYPVLLNGKNVAEKYGVDAFPTFFIIDKAGRIIYSHTGYEPSVHSEIEQIVNDAL